MSGHPTSPDRRVSSATGGPGSLNLGDSIPRNRWRNRAERFPEGANRSPTLKQGGPPNLVTEATSVSGDFLSYDVAMREVGQDVLDMETALFIP